MVITIIAILALLILPLFRDRVEAARKAAVQDEIMSLATAEMMAFADTHYFFRFQDLDNTMLYNDPPVRPDEEIPIAQWNRAFEPEDRDKLRTGSNAWKGPYVSLSKFKSMRLGTAVGPNGVPEFFWSYGGGVSRGGPIMDLSPGVGWLNSLRWEDDPADRILIDPWGTPYLFFGTGKLMEEGGGFAAYESDFGNAVIYSLGPDGMPGDSVPYTGTPTVLLREWGILGAGDDYYRIL